MPLSPANQRILAVTCRVFYFWRSNIPSSKCTPRRGVFSPSAIQEIPIPLCVFYVNTLLPRSTCYSSFLSKVTYFQNHIVWVIHALCKKFVTFNTPHSPVHHPEIFFSCASLIMHFFNPSFSVSPFSLHEERVPYPYGTTDFSLRQFISMYLPPAMLSPSNMEILLPVFRSISWMFQVIWPQYSCIQRQRKPRVPLPLCHPNSFPTIF